MLDLELKPGDAMDHSRWKADQGVYTHTHTHTHHFNGHFFRWTWL